MHESSTQLHCRTVRTAVILPAPRSPFLGAGGSNSPGDEVNIFKAGLAACIATLLASCQPADPSGVSVRGVQPTVEQLNITSNTAAQNLLVNDLIVKAGLTRTPGPRDPDWSIVTEAGIYEIGRQCDQYLDTLFRFDRRTQAVRQGLTATGAATATILGLASVAAAPIAITAAAFGLSAALYDAGTNSVLFTVEPSALRNVVLKGRKGYLDSLDLNKIGSRPRMMIALQGYLSQCSPAAIEANVNNAASGADSVASTNPAASARAAALAAPATTLIQRSEAVVSRPVEVTPLPVEDLLARNRKPSEVAVTKRTLIAAQNALGVLADGNFGVPGETKTRPAIEEFQRGRNKRNPAQWPAADVNGELSGRTGELLPFLSPMPPIFRTPFERAFLGNNEGALGQRLTQVSPGQLSALLDVVKVTDFQVPANSPPDVIAAKMKELRDKLAELRKARGIDPDKGGVLDARLYDSLMSQ